MNFSYQFHIYTLTIDNHDSEDSCRPAMENVYTPARLFESIYDRYSHNHVINAKEVVGWIHTHLSS